MPELRKNIITREWVIIATERGKRPSDFRRKQGSESATADEGSSFKASALIAEADKESKEAEIKKCPFCPGNENLTPPEIFSYKHKNSNKDSSWSIRVIPNKFPALTTSGELEHKQLGIYDTLNGSGIHDVIIETSDHFCDIPHMDSSQVESIISAFYERYQQIINYRPDLEHIIIFRNHGAKAGTSLAHPHSQLIATPVMPKEFWTEVKDAEMYYEYEEKCAYCRIIDFEDQTGERKVCENDSFVAISFFAARYPFETWILPRQHNASFAKMTMKEGDDLAGIVKETLSKFYYCLDDPSYNLTLNSMSKPEKKSHSYHWHLKIIPRLTTPAGFELGTGMFINVTSPEEAARFLRETKLTV